ncbi:hypothetical protein [Aureimonas fodinaquatilis]|uniref:hypothetical protein n=1 Tax=Aureimonas fodinaquatilis TaxID=2565783 RepID=UPI00165E4DBD|nr:hypothetical protein [Aureimonas fodinaquatilis]
MQNRQTLEDALHEARGDLDDAIAANRMMLKLVYVSALFGACLGFAVTIAAFRIGGVF